MQEFQKLISGVTRFDQLYGIINTMFDVLQSQFSGPQFPANPTAGQPCFRTDVHPARLYVYDGQAWQDPSALSPAVADVSEEVLQARGSAASLEARLDIALNQDGTLKGNAPASDWWTEEADPVARLSANQFTVQGDKRAIYSKRRAVMLEQGIDAKSWVVDAVYHASNDATIVSLTDDIVDTGLSGVAFGQEVGNEPNALGFRKLTLEVLNTDGKLEVDLSAFGVPPIETSWFPFLQVCGPVPYLVTPQNIQPQSFTVRLYFPDGKPGAKVSTGFAECGTGLECGNEVFCGQQVPVSGVKVGCLIPL